jgi:hypothetical protein
MHQYVRAAHCSIEACFCTRHCSGSQARDNQAEHVLTAYLLLLLLQTRRQVKAGDSIHLISATDKGGALALNLPPAASSSKHTSNGAYNYDDAESIDSSAAAAAAAGPAVKVMPTTIKGGIDEQLYTWQITVSGTETVASVTATTVIAVVLRQSRSCLTQHRRKQLVE